MFAEIAVHTPMARRLETGHDANTADGPESLGLTFHYAVPPELADTLKVGHLVWVPFGKQELHGVVLDLVDRPPAGVQARPILDLVLPEPVCTPSLLQLARWMSRRYLAPILDCVLTLLPPGLIQKAEPVLALSSRARRALAGDAPDSSGGVSRRQEEIQGAAPPLEHPRQMSFQTGDFADILQPGAYFPQFPNLTPSQHALLALLQAREQVPLRVLQRQQPDLVRASVVDPLLEQGLAVRARRITETPLGPKTGKQVTLLANEKTIHQVLPTLGRASKQADALAWLANNPAPPPELTAVCEAIGASPAPLHSLAQRGWIEVTPAQRHLEVTLSDSQVEEVLANELARAPVQAAALQALQEVSTAGPVRVDESSARAQHGITANTLAALERRGYIRRFYHDSSVRLLIPQSEVRERLIELRGGEKFQAVLEALAGEEDPVWVGWLYAETGTDLSTLRQLADAGMIGLSEDEIDRDPLASREFVSDRPPAWTEDQARAWQAIEEGLKGASGKWQTALGELQGAGSKGQRAGSPLGSQSAGGTWQIAEGKLPRAFLLHGVTGSGKTEIYLRAIEATLQAGRQAIALVPEIALTPQTVRRFGARFGERVAVTHSGLSPGERYDVWRKARDGQVDVVVGTRSALFLPMPRLGLIVLDEEHDSSYKEAQRAPRYHAREAALHLGRLTDAVVVLGSATPSLEAYHSTQLGHLELLELPRRIMGHARAIAEQQQRLHLRQTVYKPVGEFLQEARYAEMPPVQVVDLRQELRAGNRSMFSRALQKALDDVLRAQQQAILFLNRRGSSTFIMCRDCGHVLTCDHCDVPLTYHQSNHSAEIVCHHCGRRARSPDRCPECASRRIRYLGAGTEKVAEQVRTLWPTARVVRWDLDVTGRKGSHEAILNQFARHQADIMVGTQMIAKGLDLPLVTLVGVVSADIGLYLPDFRAAERSFQLLTQVAGRAGRSLLGGRVIVQSYRPEHYAIQASRRHDYQDFLRQEMAFRRELGYPPFRRLARLVFVHGDRKRVREEAEALARGLSFAIRDLDLQGVDLIGPAPCFFSRERGKYRWQVVVRAVDPPAFLRQVPIPQGWRVDVDPVNLL